MRVLFPPSTNCRRNGPREVGGKPAATWCIRDVKGELQGVHVRFDRDGGKDFFWRLPDMS